MKLIIFGDSIAQGCWDDEGGWPVRLLNEVNKKQLDEAEPYKDYNMTYIRGVSGDTSRGLNNRIMREMEPMSTNSHTTVVIAIGFNDSIAEDGGNRVPKEETRENLEEIIEKCREEADELIFVGMTPVDESRTDPLPNEPGSSYLNSEVKEYEEIVREVAEEHSMKFIPLFDQLKGESWNEKLWDGVHPNSEGHKRIFEIVKPEIFEELEFQLSD